MPGPAASTPLLVPLDQAAGLGLGADRIGSKAANLARPSRPPGSSAGSHPSRPTGTSDLAAHREQQARRFTLAWPLLRHCALRLGEHLHAGGVIDQAEDVFFLTRGELDRPFSLRGQVGQRRATWERQRRLLAPLTIGRPPRLVQRELLASVNAVRTSATAVEGAIVGQPASPGRATGPVRLVAGPADFDRFQPGEVLVARAAAPAWTPLFARAAAVVTDGGTLAAHASLVAREYGIPAVVATGDATTRLSDGQRVTVDSGAGTVYPHT